LTTTQEAVAGTLTGSELTRIVQGGLNAQVSLQKIASLTSGQLFVNAADPKWGIMGDGVTDDAPAINAMSAYAQSIGATKIVFPSGKTYRVTSTFLRPRQNLIWDGQGSTFITSIGYPTLPNGLWYNDSYDTKTFIGNITGNGVVAPTNQLTLSSVAGLVVGDWIGVLLGTDPYDNSSAYYAFVAQVTAINTGTSVITFDWVITQNINFLAYNYIPKLPPSTPIAVPATPTGSGLNNFRAVYRMTADVAINLTFRDMVIMGDVGGNIPAGIALQYGANIRCENIIGNPGDVGTMGSGLFLLQYCRNVRIDNCYLGCNATANRGMFGFASCEDIVVTGHFSKNLGSSVAFCEDGCTKISFVNPVDVVNQATIGSSFNGYFLARTNAEFVNPTVISDVPGSNQNFTWYDLQADGECRVSGVFKWRGPLGYLVSYSASRLNCLFDFDDPSVGWARIDFAGKNIYKFKIPLTSSMSAVTFEIPGGLSDLDIIASNGVTVSTVTGLNIFGMNLLGSTISADVSGQLVAGKVVNVGGSLFNTAGLTMLGQISGGITSWVGQPTTINLYTSAAAQAPGNFIGIVARVPRVLESNIGIFGWGGSYALTDTQLNLLLTGTAPGSSVLLSSTGTVAWDNGSGTLDVLLSRDGPGALGQRNGTNAQELRIYNTYTDAFHYECAAIDWQTFPGNLIMGAQAGSVGGTLRDLYLTGGTRIVFNVGGANLGLFNNLPQFSLSADLILAANHVMAVGSAILAEYGGSTFNSKVFNVGSSATLTDGGMIYQNQYGSFIQLSSSTTVTITIASPAVISWTAHGAVPGQAVQFTTTGALPTGITASTTYYVLATGLTANSFQIAATPGGTAIVTSGSQSGVHTGTFQVVAPPPPAPFLTWGPSGLPGGEVTPAITLAPTWNTIGAAKGLLINPTIITTPAADARLLDVQANGTTRMNVDAAGNVAIGSAAIATTATDGFLYVETCAGTPTGVPTTKTGRVPLVYDTTNHQFWIYDGGWKQPKTPAGAALVTWQ
jgi:hypothetical protein